VNYQYRVFNHRGGKNKL